MARYSDPIHPEHAVRRFGGHAGNYIVHFTDGSAYPGRQSRGTNRIRVHLRTWAEEVLAVQFMHDHLDDGCVRADREETAVVTLVTLGVPVRNRIMPSIPRVCRPRR